MTMKMQRLQAIAGRLEKILNYLEKKVSGEDSGITREQALMLICHCKREMKIIKSLNYLEKGESARKSSSSKTPDQDTWIQDVKKFNR